MKKRISDKQRQRVIRLNETTALSTHQIAKRVGISQWSVRDILNGHTADRQRIEQGWAVRGYDEVALEMGIGRNQVIALERSALAKLKQDKRMLSIWDAFQDNEAYRQVGIRSTSIWRIFQEAPVSPFYETVRPYQGYTSDNYAE